jgi:two-component system cell cycle response regulator DivK
MLSESIAPEQEGALASGGKTILIAEDFADIRDAMKILIEFEGHRVVIARDGREAVEKARLTRPDLILMDIAMPVYDGLEATRQIRSDPELKDTPIVAVTSYSKVFYSDALAAGCNKVIDKPMLIDQLDELLGTMLG